MADNLGEEEKMALLELVTEEWSRAKVLSPGFWASAPGELRKKLYKMNPTKFSIYTERQPIVLTLAYNKIRRESVGALPQRKVLPKKKKAIPVQKVETPEQIVPEKKPAKEPASSKEEKNTLASVPKPKVTAQNRLPHAIRALMPHINPSSSNVESMEAIMKKTYNKRPVQTPEADHIDKYKKRIKIDREFEKIVKTSAAITKATICSCKFGWCRRALEEKNLSDREITIPVVRVPYYNIVTGKDVSRTDKAKIIKMIVNLTDDDGVNKICASVYTFAAHHFDLSLITANRKMHLSALTISTEKPIVNDEAKLKEMFKNVIFLENIIEDLKSLDGIQELRTRIFMLEKKLLATRTTDTGKRS